MASALTEKFSRLVKQVSGEARLTENNVQEMLREVRMALLDADVGLPVVRIRRPRKEKALGQEVAAAQAGPGRVSVDRSWCTSWAMAAGHRFATSRRAVI